MNLRNMTKSAQEIRKEIMNAFEEKGWSWDTHAGQATIKILPIISAIMQRELSGFKEMVWSLTDTINTADFTSDRARDAVLLYNALLRSGMEKEDLKEAVCSFLNGEKTYEQKYIPEQNNGVEE